MLRMKDPLKNRQFFIMVENAMRFLNGLLASRLEGAEKSLLSLEK